jgi:D-glycero-alpha-D-manno-heptose 1-phosphate guanylyltransferase
VQVTCRRETTPLGTGGGFLHCVPENVAGRAIWLVANGDSLVLAPPRPLQDLVAGGRADAAVLGKSLEDASRFGTLELDASDCLTQFREKRPGAGVINTGVYAFSGDAMRGLPRGRPLSFETEVFPALAATRRVAVARTEAAFLDIGTPASLAQAELFITQHQHEFLP